MGLRRWPRASRSSPTCVTLRFTSGLPSCSERYAGLLQPGHSRGPGAGRSSMFLRFLLRARAALCWPEHPARSSDAALTQELTDAIPYDMRESHGSADDLAHGRRLIRRRWIQRGSAALVAAVLIVVAGVLLVPTRTPVPPLAPSAPVATPSQQACDTV